MGSGPEPYRRNVTCTSPQDSISNVECEWRGSQKTSEAPVGAQPAQHKDAAPSSARHPEICVAPRRLQGADGSWQRQSQALVS